MSQTDASTQPAPSAGPFTAAITGIAQWRTALKVRRTILARSGSSSGFAARNSLRSRPAQNARVPAPVKIAQLTSVRAPMASNVSAIWP